MSQFFEHLEPSNYGSWFYIKPSTGPNEIGLACPVCGRTNTIDYPSINDLVIPAQVLNFICLWCGFGPDTIKLNNFIKI